MSGDWFRIVKLNDLHVPFEDEDAVRCAIDFCKMLQPDIVVIDEWMDFYELSNFVKDPRTATGYTLHEARERCKKYHRALRRAVPDARIIEVRANHGKRLDNFLKKNASALCGLPEFKMEKFMEYDKLGISCMDYYVHRGIFMFKHGDRIHKFSGYTAKNEFESEGMSGASGHSHRLGQHYRTLRGGEYTWIECGCLCRMDMDYLEGRIADWQLGIGLIQFRGDDKHFAAMALPIIDYEILWS